MLDFLAASGAQQGGGLLGFVPIILILLIFWLLLFRPQMKRAKEHQEKVAGLKKNDKVVTAGGIVGKITKVDDDYAEVEIAQGTRIKVVKNTIGDILAPGGKPAND